MPATDQADYFSTQVMRTRRFFLPEWQERQRDGATLCLVGGGCEWCAPDFIVDRQDFPFLAFEFVSRGKGSATLANQKHEVEAGHAFFYDSSVPHVISNSAEEPMVKYFFNFTGSRAASLMSDLDLAAGSVLRVADASRVVSLLEEVIDHALRGGRFGLRTACAALEHALVLCDELPLAVGHLPARFGGLRPAVEPAAIAAPMVTSAPRAENLHATPPAVESPLPAAAPAVSRPRPESLRELEMRAILEGLDRNKGNKARTAEELGISLKTLYNKLHQLNDGTLDNTG